MRKSTEYTRGTINDAWATRGPCFRNSQLKLNSVSGSNMELKGTAAHIGAVCMMWLDSQIIGKF